MGALASLGQNSGHPDGIETPAVPPNLEPPTGNSLYLVGHARGTQDYVCSHLANGFSWVFSGPQATLFENVKWKRGEVPRQIITHFLSPNPTENDTPRATWQSSIDTSLVWAKAAASSSDAGFVAPGAIPWLLLQAVGNKQGPAGGDFVARTTYIQRVHTTGGTKPVSGCGQASEAGGRTFVPYTADYYFYRASER